MQRFVDKGNSLNIDALEYFLAVAETGSISSASEDFFISQQGLNKALSALEQELGHQLMKRSSRGIQLTESGQIVKEYALKFMELKKDMKRDLDERTETETLLREESIKIASSRLCLYSILQPLMDCGFLSKALIVEATSDKTLEIAQDPNWIAITEITPQDSNNLAADHIEHRILLTTKIGIVYRKSCFPDIPKVLDPKDIKNLPLGINNDVGISNAASVLLGDEKPDSTVVQSSSLDFLTKRMMEGSCVFFTDSYFWFKTIRPLSKPNDRVVFSQVGDYEASIVIATSMLASTKTQQIANVLTNFLHAQDAAAGWIH